MSTADPRIRNLAVGLAVRDGHVLVQEFGGAEGEPAFVRAIGGGIEFGERAADALRREFKEELDLDVTGAELLTVSENLFTFLGNPGHEIVHLFAVECPALAVWSLDDRVGVNDDASTVAWHRLDALGDEGLPFYPQGALEAARSMLDRGIVARA